VDERRHHQGPSQSEDHPSLLHPRSSRRWTLAVFDAPEEQLVEELDRLRNVGWGPGFQGELVRVKSKTDKLTRAENQEPGTGLTLEKDELEEWLVARKALMVCREIVRTEKSYREGLIKLQRGEVSFVAFTAKPLVEPPLIIYLQDSEPAITAPVAIPSCSDFYLASIQRSTR
jgi:hypothetical protein